MTALGDARQNRDTAQQQLTELTAQLAAAGMSPRWRSGNRRAHREARHRLAKRQLRSPRNRSTPYVKPSSQPSPTPLTESMRRCPSHCYPCASKTGSPDRICSFASIPTTSISTPTAQLELTLDEAARGRTYWQQVAAGADTRDAWRQLARFHGRQRGEWIARSTQDISTAPPARAGSWTRAARTDLLPHPPGRPRLHRQRSGVRSDRRTPTPDRLTVGPAPDDGTGPPPPGGTDALAQIAPEMKWLFDFDTAVATGMALRVPLLQTASWRRG